MANKNATKSEKSESGSSAKRYLSQADVPTYTLDQALRIPKAIMDEHAGKPTRPLDVAHAMSVQPGSGSFRMLCGAAIAYGLTDGGYNADLIALTDLGRTVLSKEGQPEGLRARREATLRPRIIHEFLNKYDGSKMPREDVALKVLEGLGVPPDALDRANRLVSDAAKSAGFLKEINGVQYVDLSQTDSHGEPELHLEKISTAEQIENPEAREKPKTLVSAEISDLLKDRAKRVFVTHGKNRELVPQLKELLEFGQLEPRVSVERESVSKPVPDKVIDDMRACGAAIIHVDADKEVLTNEGEREVILNGNVLIEIGAAMALYGRRFILLVHEGIRLPSNLQGLYEVRYSGTKLDGEATLRLLKVFNELKTLPLAP
jgi:predicted nucleotide-binding protein